MLFCFYTDTVNSSVYWIYEGKDKCIWGNITWGNSTSRHRKGGWTLVCKIIFIKYNITCAIFIVSVRPRLIFDLLKKRFEFDGETNQFWENCCSKNDSLHFSENKKIPSLCSLNGIFGTSSHHCQPLNVLVPSSRYFPHRSSCMWDLKLAALPAKLPFLTWHRLNSRSARGSSVTT